MMFYFGSPLSRLGRWMKNHEISQMELANRSGVPRGTIGNLSRDQTKKPSRRTGAKLIKAIQTVDPNAKESDFWNL